MTEAAERMEQSTRIADQVGNRTFRSSTVQAEIGQGFGEGRREVLALLEAKGSILSQRGLVMQSTIAVPTQHLPLPYVPALPAEFVLLLQSAGSRKQH